MQPYNPDQSPYNPTPFNQMPPPAPKRERRGLLIVGIIALALFATCAICAWAAPALSSGSTTAKKVDGAPVATDTPTDTPTEIPTATMDASIPTSTPAPTAAPPKWVTTHTFTGSGNKKTELIDVPDDWRIKWTCNQGDIAALYGQYNLILAVNNSDGSTMDYGAINELCKSGNVSGETEEHQAGSVYLDIISEAGWTIQIQEFQ